MQRRTSLREANSNCELFRSESTRFGSFLGGGSATGDVSSFFQDLLQLIAGLPKSTSLPQLSPAPSSKCRPCRSNHSAVLPPNCLLQLYDLTKTCFFYSWSPYMTRLNSIINSTCIKHFANMNCQVEVQIPKQRRRPLRPCHIASESPPRGERGRPVYKGG